jgi:alanine racemase
MRANLARIREVAPRSKVMAVVKANAYGHGLVPTALCLAEADAFAVARLEEALALRGAGVRKPIVLLEGVFNAEQLAEAARQNLEIVVHEREQLALLERASAGHRYVVWLKIDTGMNRLGFRATQVEAALAALTSMGERLHELRLLTHFASSDENDNPLNGQQLARFGELTQGRNLTRSLANSAAVFALPAAHADWVRPGLALYGVSPFAEQVGSALGLTPAMRLVSTVIAVREVPAGETVGYGGNWRANCGRRLWRWTAAGAAERDASAGARATRRIGRARLHGHDRSGCDQRERCAGGRHRRAVGPGTARRGNRRACRHHQL